MLVTGNVGNTTGNVGNVGNTCQAGNVGNEDDIGNYGNVSMSITRVNIESSYIATGIFMFYYYC